MSERFVSEPLTPTGEVFDLSRMAAGAPGIPAAFRWRDRTLAVASVLSSWRETGKCTHGSPERYVRKHWYEVLTTENEIVKIYFDRHSRRGSKAARWWLFSIRTPDEEGGASSP